jgi:hypothetical protein
MLARTETAAKGTRSERGRTVPATLKLIREGVGIELRRGTFDVLVDGKSVGSIELHSTVEAAIAPGSHTLKIRRGRYSSRDCMFEASEADVVNFRCHGANIWPRWLASYAVPALAISLSRE